MLIYDISLFLSSSHLVNIIYKDLIYIATYTVSNAGYAHLYKKQIFKPLIASLAENEYACL